MISSQWPCFARYRLGAGMRPRRADRDATDTTWRVPAVALRAPHGARNPYPQAGSGPSHRAARLM